jgi:flagellar biosynthesis/type III secretory pathway protein FliH
MTQTLLQKPSTLRDIRLSVLGFHREERLAPPVDQEAQRRKIEHEAYRRGVAAATEACEERVRTLREELEARHREEVGVFLEQLSQKMSSQLAERMEVLEKALLQLTVEAVAKIVGSLPITVDVIEASLRETLGAAAGVPVLRVMLNPEDLKMLENASYSEIRSQCAARGIQMTPDPAVDRGGCLVETSSGFVDGLRSSRISSFSSALEGA